MDDSELAEAVSLHPEPEQNNERHTNLRSFQLAKPVGLRKLVLFLSPEAPFPLTL